MRNLHYLELFYYVARYRGVTRAIRHMPYKISQPAVSMQILQLEDRLGCTLFQRQPFQLTAAGEKLFAHLSQFFENLDDVLAGLRGPGPRVVRLASTPLVLREYLPPILTRLRRRFTDVLFSLFEGSQREIDRWFEEREVDVMINVLEGKQPSGCRVLQLLEVPIVLLVPLNSPIKALSDLLKLERHQVHLLCFPPDDAIARGFRQGLVRWPVGWITLIQSNSIELVETQARDGHGIGVSVLIPGRKLPPGVRAVSLPGFPRIKVAAVWRGPRDPATEALLEELKAEVRRL